MNVLQFTFIKPKNNSFDCNITSCVLVEFVLLLSYNYNSVMCLCATISAQKRCSVRLYFCFVKSSCKYYCGIILIW